MFGIEGIEAMELGSGILGLEPPVDGDLGRVALLHRGPDFPPQRVFIGEPLLQTGADQYAELYFGHVQPTAMVEAMGACDVRTHPAQVEVNA